MRIVKEAGVHLEKGNIQVIIKGTIKEAAVGQGQDQE